MKRFWVLIALSLLLAAVTTASLLLIPPAVQNRFRPIPVYAQLVYNNSTPKGFLSFFPMLGKNEDDSSEGWNEKFQALEKFPLAVATVPFGGRDRRDAWVAVSELGGPAALFFRWRLLLFPPEGVSPARSYAAWPIWALEHPMLPAWVRVRFTLTDGLLICSISDDSHDIYHLLDTLDGRTASLANPRNFL